MIKISAVIITHNEEKNIARCLHSIAGLADEVVVVDSNSTDNTVQISRDLGARIVNHIFEGHIQQKNFAITQASNPIILSMDADECLDETLKQEISKLKRNFNVDGYSMNRLTNYCGQWIKHCGWYPDVKLRLWDSRKGKWGGINPHDKFEMHKPDAKIQHLKGNLLHYSYYTVADHRNRSHRYAEISAKALFEQGVTISYPMIYIKGFSKFIRNYILHLGFLDGINGIRICWITAIETFRKYYLLFKMHKKKPETK